MIAGDQNPNQRRSHEHAENAGDPIHDLIVVDKQQLNLWSESGLRLELFAPRSF